MKTCSRCSIKKSLSLFRKDPRYTTDGRIGVCIQCNQERTKELEHSPQRKETYVKYRKTEKGKATHNKSQKIYAIKHPEKCKAHSKVRYAIIIGKLTRGFCEVCGIENPHAHHDDYSKPFNIRWLCHKHHIEYHQQQNLVGG